MLAAKYLVDQQIRDKEIGSCWENAMKTVPKDSIGSLMCNHMLKKTIRENCKGVRLSCLIKCNTDTRLSAAPALLQNVIGECYL